MPADGLAPALAALTDLGYAVATDWLPVRVELTDGHAAVDLHPLHYRPNGSAWQAGLGDTSFDYPADAWTTGVIAGRQVRCLTVATQRLFHAGYQPREIDRHDLAVLDGLNSLDKERDRDAAGRARQARPRDALGRPLPYGEQGVQPVSEEPLPPEETVAVARALVREGRTFSAHEVLEARWKAGPAEERDLWQGLAQLCVGVTHAARGNLVGAERLVERGAGRLESYRESGGPTYGLDLPHVITWARAAVARSTSS